MTAWHNDNQHQQRTGEESFFQRHDRLMKSFRRAHPGIELKPPEGTAASWLYLPLIWQVKVESYRQN